MRARAPLPPRGAASRWTRGDRPRLVLLELRDSPARATPRTVVDRGAETDAITWSAVWSAACSNRSDGSLTRIPPGASVPSTGPLRLLHDVAQLVRDAFAGRSVAARVVLAALEHDVAIRRCRRSRRPTRPTCDACASVWTRTSSNDAPNADSIGAAGALVERRAPAGADHVVDRRRLLGLLLVAREQLHDAGVAGGALEVHHGRCVQRRVIARARTATRSRMTGWPRRAPAGASPAWSLPARSRASGNLLSQRQHPPT